MDDEKKISLGESILAVLSCLFADGIEALVMLIGVVPFITPLALGISWFINFFVWAIIQLWLILKGVRNLWFFSGSLLEYIPFIDVLPIRTATIIAVIFMANHPKITRAASLAQTATAIKNPKAAPSETNLIKETKETTE